MSIRNNYNGTFTVTLVIGSNTSAAMQMPVGH